MLAPTQPFALHRIATHARQRSCERGLEPRLSPVLAATISLVLQGGVLAAARLPQLAVLPVLGTLLLPAAFVLVQAELERAHDPAAAGAARRLSWPACVVGTLGSIVVGVALVGSYTGGGFERLLGRSLPAGEPVGGPTSGWSVSPAASGWIRVPSGRFGDRGSELELAGPDGEPWVVAYVTPAAPSELDALVARRASLLAAAAPEAPLQERRFLFPGLDLAPASHMRLATGGWLGGVFHVLIVSGAERSIEVVGYAPQRSEREVHALVESLKLAPDGAIR